LQGYHNGNHWFRRCRDEYTSISIFRLTSEKNEEGLVLDEAVSRDSIHPRKWHHILFSYIEVLENNEEDEPTLVGQVFNEIQTKYSVKYKQGIQ
jgi:hypothetical protein